MISFPQSVTLLHPEPPSGGSSGITSTAASALIVREESELADDHHGKKSKITLLMPSTVAPQAGDRISCLGRTYEIVHIRRCRDIGSGNFVFRIQAVY